MYTTSQVGISLKTQKLSQFSDFILQQNLELYVNEGRNISILL